MILIDTTIWIDFFRQTSKESILYKLIEEEDLCTCGIIETEILQGIRDQKFFNFVEGYFKELLFLEIQRSDYALAANLYRKARAKGYTVRSTVDCIIAACAITNNVPVFTRDRDFGKLALISNLKLYAATLK